MLGSELENWHDLESHFIFDHNEEMVKDYLLQYPLAFRHVFEELMDYESEGVEVDLPGHEGTLRFTPQDGKIGVSFVEPHENLFTNKFNLLMTHVYNEIAEEDKIRDEFMEYSKQKQLSDRGIDDTTLDEINTFMDEGYYDTSAS